MALLGRLFECATTINQTLTSRQRRHSAPNGEPRDEAESPSRGKGKGLREKQGDADCNKIIERDEWKNDAGLANISHLLVLVTLYPQISHHMTRPLDIRELSTCESKLPSGEDAVA